jgi:hypothetical protein
MPPGTLGHAPTPKKGDFVRAYLVRDGYNGYAVTKDKGYDVYFRNGFEVLGSATHSLKRE